MQLCNKSCLIRGGFMLLAYAACFAILQCFFKYHFFHQEQNQLFLMDYNYVSSYLWQRGWLANLLGDFLTQLYYYLYAGPAILSAFIIATGIGIYGGVVMVTKTMKEIIATVVSVACTATLLVCAMKFDMRLSHIIALAGCTNTLLLWFVFGGKQWWKRIVTGCICAAIIVHFF